MVQADDAQVKAEEYAIFIDDRACLAKPLPRTPEMQALIDGLLDEFMAEVKEPALS